MTPLAHHHRRAPGARPGERGSVLPLVAICLTVLVTCTALTVDLGRVGTLRRDLQNVADAAALDLVRLVDGRTAAAIVGDGRWAATLQAALDRNGFAVGGAAAVTARLGRYDAGTDTFTPTAGGEVPSAVSVEVTDRVEHQLAPGGTTTSRHAVAAQSASAGIQVGSFAARLDPGSSALLGPLLGDALGVDVVGYRGLAGGRIGIEALATELGLSLASPEELLATELELEELVEAQATLLRRAGDVARAHVLDALALRLPPTAGPVALGDLITIGAGGAAAAAAATVDVLELLTTAALVSDGDHALSLPGLALGVPGVAATTVGLQVVEAPRLAFGGPGTTVRTAQVRLTARVDLAAAGLAGARLDLAVEVASAEVVVDAISCGTPQTLDLRATTGLVDTDLSVSTQLAVDLLGLASVTVADATITATAGRAAGAATVGFVLPPDPFGEPWTISSGTLGIGDLVLTPTVTVLPAAQLPPLLRTALGLVTSTAGTVATTVLSPLVAATLTTLDATVVRPLLSLLGVTAPGADVTPLSVRCTGPRLLA